MDNFNRPLAVARRVSHANQGNTSRRRRQPSASGAWPDNINRPMGQPNALNALRGSSKTAMERLCALAALAVNTSPLREALPRVSHALKASFKARPWQQSALTVRLESSKLLLAQQPVQCAHLVNTNPLRAAARPALLAKQVNTKLWTKQPIASSARQDSTKMKLAKPSALVAAVASTSLSVEVALRVFRALVVSTKVKILQPVVRNAQLGGFKMPVEHLHATVVTGEDSKQLWAVTRNAPHVPWDFFNDRAAKLNATSATQAGFKMPQQVRLVSHASKDSSESLEARRLLAQCVPWGVLSLKQVEVVVPSAVLGSTKPQLASRRAQAATPDSRSQK